MVYGVIAVLLVVIVVAINSGNKKRNNVSYDVYLPILEELKDNEFWIQCGTLYDLDDNGVNELVCIYSNDYFHELCSIYTIDDSGEVVTLLSDSLVTTYAGGNSGSVMFVEDQGQKYIVIRNSVPTDYVTTVDWSVVSIEGTKAYENKVINYVHSDVNDELTHIKMNDQNISFKEFNQWRENLEIIWQMGDAYQSNNIASLDDLYLLIEDNRLDDLAVDTLNDNIIDYIEIYVYWDQHGDENYNVGLLLEEIDGTPSNYHFDSFDESAYIRFYDLDNDFFFTMIALNLEEGMFNCTGDLEPYVTVKLAGSKEKITIKMSDEAYDHMVRYPTGVWGWRPFMISDNKIISDF